MWYSSTKENNKSYELIKKKKFRLIKSSNILFASMVLENPTWFPFVGETMQFIVLVSQDDEEVLVHTFA